MSESNPHVALGMPVYNGQKYLRDALQSIVGQTYRNFELVICDNASSDNTETICREFAARDERIRYVRNPTNLGAHPNYNRTFELTSGKYFKWVPHDDVLDPRYLEACVAALERHPEAVLCQSDLDFIDGCGKHIGVCGTDLVEAHAPQVRTRFAAATLNAHNCYEVMGLYRRSTLETSMLLKSFHGADRALIAQLTLRGPFLHVSEPLLRVRDHKDRYTRARVRPKERAVWHDAKLKGKHSFPTWHLYGEYWRMVLKARLRLTERIAAIVALLAWWFVNWNAARAAVDVIATIAPEMVGWAQRVKQRLFSPAPGIDAVKKSHR
jgi:glycosyltransferase involved in cell wall biosynthesis